MGSNLSLKLTGLAIAFTISTLATQPVAAQSAPGPDVCAAFDFNGNGHVDFIDAAILLTRRNIESGEARYLEGLDLNEDSVIDVAGDYLAIIAAGCFGRPATTAPTRLSGVVYDGDGNPLENALVQVGEGVSGCTDPNGVYNIEVPLDETGVTDITIDGGGASGMTDCGAIVDPNQAFSGQFPVIPHKPLLVNPGTDNLFRIVTLPERDLHNSIDLSVANAQDNGNGVWTLGENVVYDNGGVLMSIPANCTITFPPGEDPVLSTTRIDPSVLPIAMPPGLQSSIFVTFQPGGTKISCPSGSAQIFAEFDNLDAYSVGDGPFIAGVVDGVFTALNVDGNGDPVPCDVIDADSDSQLADIDDLLHCPVGTDFQFAWYHVDIPPSPECERTTVQGRIIQAAVGCSAAVRGATASTWGSTPVTTNASCEFSIPNIPAGPNGPNCMANAFGVRVTGVKDLNSNGIINGADTSTSDLIPAVSGGITDVGDIILGQTGVVQGRLLKLFSLDPFIVKPLGDGIDGVVGAEAQLSAGTFTPPAQPTNPVGFYHFSEVPVSTFNVQASVQDPSFFELRADEISGPGNVKRLDFRFVSSGAVEVEVEDVDGNPAFVILDVTPIGAALGFGFQQPFFVGDSQSTTDSETGVGVVTAPLGPCELTILHPFTQEVLHTVSQFDGCLVNEHNQVTILPKVILDVALSPATHDGDVTSVDFLPDNNGGLQVEIVYSQPFPDGVTFSGALFLVEFDFTDGAGGLSLIDLTAPPSGATGLSGEVDASVLCSFAFCNAQDGDGNLIAFYDGALISPNEPNKIVFSIPPSVLTGISAKVAVLSQIPAVGDGEGPIGLAAPALTSSNLDLVPGSTSGTGGTIDTPDVGGGFGDADPTGDTYPGSIFGVDGEF